MIPKKILCGLVVSTTALLIASSPVATAAEPSTAQPRFAEVARDFPQEDKNLRKWDTPVVADLDQDGYVDLVLNDHGFGVRIAWNNKGRFAKPYDLVMGDHHGITIGDIDDDGNLEILISRGGGSGSNARNAKIYRVNRKREFTEVPALAKPLQAMRGRTLKLFDGDNDGDLDLINFAFPSKENRGKSENYIYRNDGKGKFTLAGTLPATKVDGQKTLLTDFNNDQIVDFLLYGHGQVRAYQGGGDLTYSEVTDLVLPLAITDVTSIVELDYDNDGDFDLYFSRGREFTPGETFYNQDTQSWGFFTKRGEFLFDELVVGDVLKLDNLQTQWPHKTLFIGESAYEYEFPGETHSGRDIRIVNSDALGWPDSTEKKGSYLGYVGNQQWRLNINIWSPASGIIRGVQTPPAKKHDKGNTQGGLPPQVRDMLLENQEGQLVDVTEQSGIRLQEHTTGAAAADFDNNGYQDLVVIRRGDLVHANESVVYLNHGDAGFEQLADPGVVSPELGAIGLGASTLDYNHDGKVDVLIGNERGKWHLFKNEALMGDSANYLVVEVGRTETSHAPGLGATVTVQTTSGQQVQHVGATSAAYSLSYDRAMHFGLGESSSPVDVKVTWTDGRVTERTVSKINRTLKITPNPSE